MDGSLFTEVCARPERESERPDFPPGFPDPIDVPAARYVDPHFHELEKAHVFARVWQFAGCADQIPNSGDYVLLEAYPAPLFLIRGDDGIIRCFYNTCQHRGAALLTEPSGNKGAIVCPYHAWTYGRHGNLRGYPEAKNYPRNADKDCLALKSVRCETYGALVFINFDADAHALRDHLGPVADELDDLIGDRSRGVHFFASEIQWIDANWKFAGDANIETYHVPYLHRDTAHLAIDSERTGQWLLANGHSRMMIKLRPAARDSMTKSAATMPAFPGLSRNPLPLEGVYSFHLFPNISIVMAGPSMFFVIAAVPHGPDRHAYAVHYLCAAPPDGPARPLFQALKDSNARVLGQDLAVLPTQHASMKSSAIGALRLQYQERRIRRLHEDLDRWIGAQNVPGPLRTPALLDAFVEEQ